MSLVKMKDAVRMQTEDAVKMAQSELRHTKEKTM